MKKAILAALVCVLSSFAAQAKDKVSGLVCDFRGGAQDLKVSIEITVNGPAARLVFKNPANVLRTMGMANLQTSEIQPLLNANLKVLFGKTLVDAGRKVSLSFKDGGSTYDRKPRISIDVTDANGVRSFTGCDLTYDKPYVY
ncbi:MAG: hypothetical protein ABL958_10905 [Bdellovibrionia bacterium]